jgi:predicted esterase
MDFKGTAPVNNFSRANASIFLIHGKEDTTIPFAQRQRLAEMGRAEKIGGRIVPGKEYSNSHTNAQFWEKVNTFLQETLFIFKPGL